MAAEYNIKKLRSMWQHLVDETTNLNLGAVELMKGSPSTLIKYYAKLNFYNRLLENTNELTTRDELIELLNEMELNPTVPQGVLDREYYLEQWDSWIRLTHV